MIENAVAEVAQAAAETVEAVNAVEQVEPMVIEATMKKGVSTGTAVLFGGGIGMALGVGLVVLVDFLYSKHKNAKKPPEA